MSSSQFSIPPSLRGVEFVQDWTKFITGLFTPGEERWIRHNLIAKICAVTPGTSISEKLTSAEGLDRSADFVSKFLALGGAVTPADLTPKEVVALGRRLLKDHPEIFKPVEFFSLAGHSVYGKVTEMFSAGIPRFPITAADFRALQQSLDQIPLSPTPLEVLVQQEAQNNRRISKPEFDYRRSEILAQQYLRLGTYSPTKLAVEWGLKPDRVVDLAKHQTDLTTDEALALIKRQGLAPETAFFLTKPSAQARREFLLVYKQRFRETAAPLTEKQIEKQLSNAKTKLDTGKIDPNPLQTVKLKFKAEAVAAREAEKKNPKAHKKTAVPAKSTTFRELKSIRVIDEDHDQSEMRESDNPVLTVNLGAIRFMVAESSGIAVGPLTDDSPLSRDADSTQLLLLKLSLGYQRAVALNNLPEEVLSIGDLKKHLRELITRRWAAVSY